MDMKKINFVKKNFYFAIIVVVLLFIAGFVIAAYDTSKASHETLYTDTIESKTAGTVVNILGGLLVDGQPLSAGSVDWGDIDNMPWGFADGIDNEGSGGGSGGGMSFGTPTRIQPNGGSNMIEDTWYQANVEGFVIASGLGSSDYGKIRIWMNSIQSKTGAVEMLQQSVHSDGGVILPVPNGWYFRVEMSRNPESAYDPLPIWWLPIVSGGGSGGGMSFGDYGSIITKTGGSTEIESIELAITQASTDLFLFAVVQPIDSSGWIRYGFKGYTSPTSGGTYTLRAGMSAQDDTDGVGAPWGVQSFAMFVKKGEYYKVTKQGLSGDGTLIRTYSTVPIVSGGGSGGGKMPMPDYDSGWYAIAAETSENFNHNLGGDHNNYLVDLNCKGTVPRPSGNNPHNYFGGLTGQTNALGAGWYDLSSTQITVWRGRFDSYCPEIRIRIWKY